MKRGFEALGPWQSRAISGLTSLTCVQLPSGREKAESSKALQRDGRVAVGPGEEAWSQEAF